MLGLGTNIIIIIITIIIIIIIKTYDVFFGGHPMAPTRSIGEAISATSSAPNKKPPRQSQNFLRFAERRQGEVKQKEELGKLG